MEGQMNYYRLYLLGEARHIRSAEPFAAEDDVHAIGVAESVFSYCSDDYDGYEVWNGLRMIADDRTLPEPSRWWAITQASQRDVLDLEDRVQRTLARISESRQLLDHVAEAGAKVQRDT
jgi:hypothetical protein